MWQQKSHNQTGIFVVDEHNGTDLNTVQCRRESHNKDGCQKPEVEMKKTQYLSFNARYQRNSKGYTHIFGNQQLGGTSLNTHRQRDK